MKERVAFISQIPFVVVVGASLLIGHNISAQATTGATAELERVIVTGSNIPTAEETGPNPVDTYRPQDLEKLGIRNATDLTTFLPQEAGFTLNQNNGDGTVQLNLRGILPKETLVLIDGKRVAQASMLIVGTDINLIPFSIVDHIDILKDGASAVYGADAVAGVVNYFLIHKFRGLEIGGSYGNTNLGASNDMGEWEAWLKAGIGDDKTDIVVIADFYQRTGGVFSRDRDISANAFFIPFGGKELRSSDEPGSVQDFRLTPSLFFSARSPPPHSAPNAATSPFYRNPFLIAPNAYPGPPGIIGPNARKHRPQTSGAYGYKGGGDYYFYNIAAVTSALPPADRQVFYGSFTRDLCNKYLTVFADFKVARSFFDVSAAAVPFLPDPFKRPGTNVGFSPVGISVPISNPFNPFTVADATVTVNGIGVPVTTGVRFRAIEDTGPRSEKFTYSDYLFDIGLKGEMGEFGEYFNTWNWEVGFRYSRNEGQNLSVGDVSQSGLRSTLLDTNPATAFNPFGGFLSTNTVAARSRVYVNLHNTATFELPMSYGTLTGNLFNLPAGPVSFALGLEYRGERWDRRPDALNTTFQTIGSTNREGARVNRDVWSTYQEIRVPFTSPTWNFAGFYSLEVDFAEREEWYSQNTSAVLSTNTPTAHSTYDTQKPKVSVRWQPLDPKWIGTAILRGSYTEAFHAPTLFELNPAGSQSFPLVVDPFSSQTERQVEERITGNPFLQPEVAYEWTYGIVYSPKWLKGLTLSVDWWHIHIRNAVTLLGAPFIIATFTGTSFVQRGPSTVPGELGPVTLVIDPLQNIGGGVNEGLDYEAIYVLDSEIFGHGNWGILTATVNGTYLSRFVAELIPNVPPKPYGIAGGFIPTSFPSSSSWPRHRANFSLFYEGPADTWLGGLDAGVTVHFTSDYNDDNLGLTASRKPNMPITGGPNTPSAFPFRARNINSWVTLDLIFNYTFNLPPPKPVEVPGYAKDGGKKATRADRKEKNVIPVSTAEYNPCGWRAWLNNTTISLGMQNALDEDPPFVAGAFENGYDESLATIKGRFWYFQLKKRF